MRNSGLLLRDAAAIRALASPSRQAIVDALEIAGPATMRGVAAHLSRRPDSLYYHMRLLCEAGIVVELPRPRNDEGRMEAVFDLAARPVELEYRPHDRGNRKAVNGVVRAMLRAAERGFVKANRPGTTALQGDTRSLWAGRAEGWLDKDDLRQVNRHIAAILEILRRPHDRKASHVGSADHSIHEFTFSMAPK